MGTPSTKQEPPTMPDLTHDFWACWEVLPLQDRQALLTWARLMCEETIDPLLLSILRDTPRGLRHAFDVSQVRIAAADHPVKRCHH